MKQHIKVRAKLIKDIVEVSVLEQSHFANYFGSTRTEYAGGLFFASNGFCLASNYRPEWVKHKDRLYLRGTSTANNQDTARVSIKDWAKIKQAIFEYNEWGEKQ